MSQDKTKEAAYESCLELARRCGQSELGLMMNHAWFKDPRRFFIGLARYKWVGKVLSGCQKVLEVGCADAFNSRLVQQEVKSLTAVDFDPIFVEDAKRRMDAAWPFDCRVHNILDGPVAEGFDGAFALDVIEHIPAQDEDRFLANLAASLNQTGVLIVGTPTIQSQQYASVESKMGHVNCKDAPALKVLLQKYFHNVFIFSMNDEVVHTGYYPMAHYLLALCCYKKA